MGAVFARLIALCAITALTERMTLAPAVRLLCGLIAAETVLELLLSLLEFA